MSDWSSTAPKPPSYLPGAILATLFCCLPFGIVSIVYAAQVDSKYNAGDIGGAMQSSENAKNWLIAAVAGGLATVLLWLVVFGGLMSS